MSKLSQLIKRASEQVIATGKPCVHRYIVDDRLDGLVLMGAETYEQEGDEERCRAVIWSYTDGDYNAENQFVPNGKIGAAVETAFD